MLEAAFVFGLVIVLGMFLIIIKLPTHITLWLLGHHLLVDILVTALALVMHWGTMTGLMAATIAGMACSLVTSFARKLVGYTYRGRYHPGFINLNA